MGIVRYHLKLSGHVQGVGYRAATQRQAQKLGLMGWVKNHPDGTVEIAVEGESVLLNQLVEWVWQGPRFAVVKHITQAESIASGEFTQFEIR